jgi:hypothetical protein
MSELLNMSDVLYNASKYRLKGDGAFKKRAAARTLEEIVDHSSKPNSNVTMSRLYKVAEHRNNIFFRIFRYFFGNEERRIQRDEVADMVVEQLSQDLLFGHKDVESATKGLVDQVLEGLYQEKAEIPKSGVVTWDYQDGVSYKVNLKTKNIVSININGEEISGNKLKHFFNVLIDLKNQNSKSMISSNVDIVSKAVNLISEEQKFDIVNKLNLLMESVDLQNLQSFVESNSPRNWYNDCGQHVNRDLVNHITEFMLINAVIYPADDPDIIRLKSALNTAIAEELENTYSNSAARSYSPKGLAITVLQDYWKQKNPVQFENIEAHLELLKQLGHYFRRDIIDTIEQSDLENQQLEILAKIFASDKDLEKEIKNTIEFKKQMSDFVDETKERKQCYALIIAVSIENMKERLVL